MLRKSLLLISFLFTGLCYSQVDFGVKAGINFSNAVYNINDASPEGRVGAYGGAFVDFELSKDFHLQPEVLYSSEGIKDGSLDFLNIPVVLKWYFFEGIHLNAGPQIGMVIDAEGGSAGLKDYNFSGIGGLGYESPGGFLVDVRFSHGITSIIDEDFSIPSGMGYDIVGVKGWTRSFHLGIGYRF